MKIYVIRHGQTNQNLEGRIQGKTDIELNAKGKEQAEEVRKFIKKYNIDLIISSPLKRARKGIIEKTNLSNCQIISYEMEQ